MNRIQPCRPRPSRGFTLVELMVVMGVVTLLVAVSIPGLSSISESTRLMRAASMVVDQISLARQIATTQSTVVEVRFIRLPDSEGYGFRGIQLWAPDKEDPGTQQHLGRLQVLPENFVISDATELGSKLLEHLDSSGSMVMPGTGTTYPYIAFYLRPNGTVVPALPSSQRKDSYLTIRSTYGDQTSLPSDYITIQLNPDSANTVVYRP